MSVLILAILIIVLASTAYYFYSNSLKLKQNFDNYQKKYKDLEDYTNTIVRLQEDLKKELEKKETYSVVLENKIKKEYEFHKNQGEFKTYEDLLYIKEQLVKNNLVQTDDFCIFNNILFRYHEEEFIRQIDHLVLTRKGLYALETKYWKGHIFHQMRVSDFDDSLKWLVPEKNNDYDFTFCVQNISKEDGNNLFKTILPKVSPFNQIKNNSTFLFKSLKEKNYPVRFIRPLVYYNYPKDKIHNVVVSKENKLDTSSRISEGFTNRQALLKFFFEELKNNDTFSKDDFSKLNTFFKKEEKRMNF